MGGWNITRRTLGPTMQCRSDWPASRPSSSGAGCHSPADRCAGYLLLLFPWRIALLLSPLLAAGIGQQPRPTGHGAAEQHDGSGKSDEGDSELPLRLRATSVTLPNAQSSSLLCNPATG